MCVFFGTGRNCHRQFNNSEYIHNLRLPVIMILCLNFYNSGCGNIHCSSVEKARKLESAWICPNISIQHKKRAFEGNTAIFQEAWSLYISFSAQSHPTCYLHFAAPTTSVFCTLKKKCLASDGRDLRTLAEAFSGVWKWRKNAETSPECMMTALAISHSSLSSGYIQRGNQYEDHSYK